MSNEGIVMASGDLNNDGLEDLIVSNAKGKSPVIFLQNSDKSFTETLLFDKKTNPNMQVADMVLFDWEKDGDLDIVLIANVINFNNQIFTPSNSILINDGKANFMALKENTLDMSAGTFVRPCDFDNDGDTDLFIGGKTWVHKYPVSESNRLLRNDEGTFVDITEDFFDTSEFSGIPKDASWVDINNDSLTDMVLLSEFQPIKIFLNKGDRFQRLLKL